MVSLQWFIWYYIMTKPHAEYFKRKKFVFGTLHVGYSFQTCQYSIIDNEKHQSLCLFFYIHEGGRSSTLPPVPVNVPLAGQGSCRVTCVSTSTSGSVYRIQQSLWLKFENPNVKFPSLMCSLLFTGIAAPIFRQCKVTDIRQINHNTKIMTCELPEGTEMHVPLGYHVYLQMDIDGELSAKHGIRFDYRRFLKKLNAAKVWNVWFELEELQFLEIEFFNWKIQMKLILLYSCHRHSRQQTLHCHTAIFAEWKGPNHRLSIRTVSSFYDKNLQWWLTYTTHWKSKTRLVVFLVYTLRICAVHCCNGYYVKTGHEIFLGLPSTALWGMFVSL